MGLMRHSLLPLFIITISRKKLKYEGVVRDMLLPSFSYLEAIIDPNFYNHFKVLDFILLWGYIK